MDLDENKKKLTVKLSDKHRVMSFTSRLLVFLTITVCVSCHSPQHYMSAVGRRPASQRSCRDLLKGLVRYNYSLENLESALRWTRPGQSSYGKPRVKWLEHQFNRWPASKIRSYFRKRPIPYVVAPDGTWVISDRHHLFLAVVKNKKLLKKKLGFKDSFLHYKKLESFKDRNWAEYRHYMETHNLIYKGHKGRQLNWDQMASRFEDMDKDYFRGLVWVLIKAGVLTKSSEPFSEFIWADALRAHFKDLPTKWRKKNIIKVIRALKNPPPELRGLQGLQTFDEEEALKRIKKYEKPLGW